MYKLQKIFKTKKPIIGAIHFSPLLGYKEYKGIDNILNNALQDLGAFEKGGVDGIILENNYDFPHTINVGPETVACMTQIAFEIKKRTMLPFGISVLWNDYKAALSIAKVCGGKFIRVPVFVDSVRTQYGDVFGNPQKVTEYRKRIESEDILLFTDIHVKHATLLSSFTLKESTRKAIDNGSGALIITGKWTGNIPNIDDLKLVRNAAGEFPILIGSGANQNNISLLAQYADGIIVSTSLKTGRGNKKMVNIKNYDERIDAQKVTKFIQSYRQFTNS